MIPAFLNDLADSIDRLASDGKSVHVSTETAKELRMLAGLPWPLVRRQEDVALGWLMASRAPCLAPLEESYTSGADKECVMRAAACAELAVLAAGWVDTNDSRYDITANPHDGTVEGARSAWSFVVDYVEVATKTGLLTSEQWTALLEKYRRELAAMR